MLKQLCLFVLGVSCLLAVAADQSYAIPAFARKYTTSCQTCHNGFPKLNGFGEAFRRNGYQFPGGTDAEYIKQDPVSLGAEGNKKAFPDAIWPGTLPASSPISIFLNGEMDWNKGTDSTPSQVSFGNLGSSIEAVAAGTLGEDLTFWGQLGLGSDGTLELNRIFLTFSNLIGSDMNFNAKIGVFEPGVFSFSTHRAWMEGYWITTRNLDDDEEADPANGMGWTLEETQKGIEVNGVMQRFGYNVGIVEGFGLTHPQKDYYGHITYKFDGMPLDGVVEGGPVINNPQPYMDNSLTLGAFLYHGTATLGSSSGFQDNRFTMGGGDVNAYYDRFNLFGGVGIRHDESPFLGDPLNQSANTKVWFGELDFVAYPWLLPGIRIESWNSERIDGGTGLTGSFTDQQIVPGVVALVRANVKMTLRTMFTKPEGADKFDFDQVMMLMAIGI